MAEFIEFMKLAGPPGSAIGAFIFLWIKVVAPELKAAREDRNNSETRAQQERLQYEARARVDNEVLERIADSLRDTASINKSTAEINLENTKRQTAADRARESAR